MSSTLFAAALVAATFAATAYAGGDHDHGDAPPLAAGDAVPAVTAVSETFELVGRLNASELSILIDRAETNAPVMNAKLSVEVDGLRADAPFHADHGDYAVADAAVLKHLHAAGVKTLTFTLVADEDSDLLTGELDVHDAAHSAAPESLRDWKTTTLWGAGALLVLVGGGLAVRRMRRVRAGGAA